ncbi:MAG: hypothetical protein GY866_05160 [Proteobacteria bacterium]|nr:hypothetical protein [Pseudomonadota bacterium]
MGARNLEFREKQRFTLIESITFVYLNLMKKLRFTPGDLNYRRDDETDSPFQKRSLMLFPFDGKLKAKLLIVKQKYYDLFFTNEKDSYLSRNLHFDPSKKATTKTKYLHEDILLANTRQIQFGIGKLLKRIITNLEQDPQKLFVEAENIRRICRDENFPIPDIKAFNNIKDWDEFLDVLKSISRNRNSFKFELMISAITQYASLCAGR